MVKTALDKNPLLKAKAENFAKNAFESIKENLQNAKLDKNTRKALESIFNKELIKALDNRAFIVGDEGLKAFEKAHKESLANLDIMASLNVKKEKALKNEYLKSRLDKAINDNEIVILSPQNEFKNLQIFKNSFDKFYKNKGLINTPLGEIKVNMLYAWEHFKKNTYNVNRENIKSAFFQTFKDPLFIVKDESKGKGSVYFYKPFYDKDKNIMYLFGISIDKSGLIEFKTFYLDKKGTRLNYLLKNDKAEIKYIKK